VSALVAEWRRIFLDPGAALILVGALVLYAVFYPIPYRANVLERVPVVVVDQDQSDLSRRLVRMVDEHQLTSVVGQAGSLAEAEKAVREGRAGGVLVIPAEFERRVRRGEQAYVGAFADASSFLVYRQALTGLLEATGTLSAGIEVRRLMAEGVPEDRAMKARDPLPLVSRPLFNPAEGYAAYIVPAVLVLILQQTLLVGMGLVGGTRREVYARRSRARLKPCSDNGICRDDGGIGTGLATLTARAFAYFSLYLVHGLFYFGVVYRLYGFPCRADAWTLFRFGTPFLLSVIFLGMVLRAAFRTREMALQVLLFTSLPALFLSGFAWPTEALPAWLATFAKAIPSTTAIPGFLRLTEMGASLSGVGAEWLTLWALCGGYFAAAWLVTWWEGRQSPATGRRSVLRPVLRVLLEEAQRLERLHPVDEQDAVEMVDLVLRHAGRVAFEVELDAVAASIERAHLDLVGTDDAAAQLREAEAAFPVLVGGLRERRHFGVDDRQHADVVVLPFAFVDADDRQADALVHLRGRQADPLVLPHRLDHVVDELLERRRLDLGGLDLPRRFPQHRVPHVRDLQDGHSSIINSETGIRLSALGLRPDTRDTAESRKSKAEGRSPIYGFATAAAGKLRFSISAWAAASATIVSIGSRLSASSTAKRVARVAGCFGVNSWQQSWSGTTEIS